MKNVYPKAMSDCGQDLRLGDKMQAVVVVYKFKKKLHSYNGRVEVNIPHFINHGYFLF